MTTAINAALARWHEALQQEARALCRRAAILSARRFDLPHDWEIAMSEAMLAHDSGITSSADFASILRRASALLAHEARP